MIEDMSETEILQKKGVKATPNRILVLRSLCRYTRPVSLPELEIDTHPMDKSSIFRVLNLFVKQHVVHAIEDGSGILKYEVCHGGDHCTLKDMHVHFHCLECGKTFCFETIHIPEIKLPEGFEVDGINYLVKGICPDCSHKK